MPDCLLEKRKRLILEQAAIVFSENGFYRATIEKIACRVKLGKGTVYRCRNLLLYNLADPFFRGRI